MLVVFLSRLDKPSDGIETEIVIMYKDRNRNPTRDSEDRERDQTETETVQYHWAREVYVAQR
jgi:hypothetical protein